MKLPIRQELVQKQQQLYSIFNDKVSEILEEHLSKEERCDIEMIMISAVALARVAFKLLMLGSKSEHDAMVFAQTAYVIEKEAFENTAKNISTEDCKMPKPAKKASSLN